MVRDKNKRKHRREMQASKLSEGKGLNSQCINKVRKAKTSVYGREKLSVDTERVLSYLL